MDIETNELSVNYFLRGKSDTDNEIRPAIYLIENLENGAGYTNHLGSMKNSEKFNAFIKPLLKGGDLFEKLTADAKIKEKNGIIYIETNEMKFSLVHPLWSSHYIDLNINTNEYPPAFITQFLRNFGKDIMLNR